MVFCTCLTLVSVLGHSEIPVTFEGSMRSPSPVTNHPRSEICGRMISHFDAFMLRLWTASHAYKEYLQTDYDTGSVRNGPGLSRDNPLCLLFNLLYSLIASQRF